MVTLKIPLHLFLFFAIYNNFKLITVTIEACFHKKKKKNRIGSRVRHIIVFLQCFIPPPPPPCFVITVSFCCVPNYYRYCCPGLSTTRNYEQQARRWRGHALIWIWRDDRRVCSSPMLPEPCTVVVTVVSSGVTNFSNLRGSGSSNNNKKNQWSKWPSINERRVLLVRPIHVKLSMF